MMIITTHNFKVSINISHTHTFYPFGYISEIVANHRDLVTYFTCPLIVRTAQINRISAQISTV